MRIAILQPGYLPWLGFFDQLWHSDRFVIYDDVQYTRRDWRSRNRIKTPKGELWLSVPIVNRGRFHQLINEAEIDYSQNWTHKHLSTIKNSYHRTPYFEKYYPKLADVFNLKPKYLLELDMALIHICAEWLNINTEIIFSSKLNISGNSTERLVNICQHLKATHYLTGNAAKDYLDESMFSKANIELEYHDYKHPFYKQLYPPFIPYLSIVDLLFNHGQDSLAILTREKILESED